MWIVTILRMCLVASIIMSVNVVGANIQKTQRPIRNRYLVQFHSTVGRAQLPTVAAEMAQQRGGRVLSVWDAAIRGFAVEMSEQAAEALANDPRITAIEEDQEITFGADCGFVEQTRSTCNDARVPWQLDRIDQRESQLDGTYSHCMPGLGNNLASNVTAYVVDSGVRRHSEFLDFEGNSRLATGWNFTSSDTSDTDDCFGHGTAAAGILAGLTGGVAKGATIVPVRIGNCTGSAGSNQRLVDATNWITNHHRGGPAVAYYGYYASGSSTLLDNAVAALVADGVVVTVVAGNSGSDACGLSPQRVSTVLTVGATTKSDTRASFSNYGSCVAVYAPGEGVGSAQYNTFGYLNCSPGWSGTSFAAPAAAGVAALIYGAQYWLDAEDVRFKVISTSTKGILGRIPNGSNNRLLFAAYPAWCAELSCDGLPPIQ